MPWQTSKILKICIGASKFTSRNIREILPSFLINLQKKGEGIGGGGNRFEQRLSGWKWKGSGENIFPCPSCRKPKEFSFSKSCHSGACLKEGDEHCLIYPSVL
jgi:hypothetical protein